MAEQILHAGPVSTYGYNPYKTSVVVGSGNQWDDADDATYATAWLSSRSDGAHQDRVRANVDAFTGSPSQVTGIRCVLRGSTQNIGGATGGILGLDLYDAASNYVVAFGYAVPQTEILPTAGIVDADIPLRDVDLSAFGKTLEQVATALTTGGTIYAFRYSTTGDAIPADYGFTVYELHIVVEYGTKRRIAHNRIVQRGNDGLGVTGGARVVQRRTIQSSSRATGIR